MDAKHFDALVHSVHTAVPRRSTLGGLLGLGLAQVFRTEEAIAKKKRKKKKCKGGKKKCGTKCISKTACCVDADCPSGATCIGSACVCPIATTDCGDACADLATDGANCGACGNVCESGACVNGACTCENADDCPGGCNCTPRVEGGSACAVKPAEAVTCETDDDCPLGSFCFEAGGEQFCSGVCQGS